MSLLGACVSSNPAWDPPTAEAQGETLGGSEADGYEGDGDLPQDSSGDDHHGDGDGDGDGDPGGDGNPWGGDGDDHGDSWGEGDGDPGGDGDGEMDQTCGKPSPSFGPCPASCDKCQDGVCYRYCDSGECQDDFLLCPVAWSCRFMCIGKNSCKDATVACTGWGSCEVECVGESACAEAEVVCAAGPCQVTCGGHGDDKPCEHLGVACGSDVTKLRCDEPYVGSGPALWPNNYNDCGCTSDCKAAK